MESGIAVAGPIQVNGVLSTAQPGGSLKQGGLMVWH
jgi:hypothetical protein